MKHRYFFPESDPRHAEEVKMYANYPSSAIQQAEDYIKRLFADSVKHEIAERVLIAIAHDRFEILTESYSEYRIYEFKYNPLTDEVKYVRMEGDWKR